MAVIEHFTVIMYSKGCGAKSVNEARHHLFRTGPKSLDNIPPTQASLYQHVKQALIQGSFYWSKALAVWQNIPNFSEWDWNKDSRNKWQHLWTTLSDVSQACSMLLHCGCTKACTGKCKCKSAGVKCIILCKCEGGCLNNNYNEDN